MVPSQAATPALVAVGFLIMAGSVRDIDWSDYTIAIPAFLTMVLMPFTYSHHQRHRHRLHRLLRAAARRPAAAARCRWRCTWSSAVFVFYYLMPALGLT